MKIVIALWVMVVAAASTVAITLHSYVPQPIANSVIGEKSDGVLIGGQAVKVLPKNLNEKQHRLLNIAYEMGKSHGFKDPEVVQAVLLQETLAGGLDTYKVANPGPQAYFGPMQIKLAAAKDVLARWPGLFKSYNFHTHSDDEIKANLILNERFNLEVGTKYLLILKKTYGFSGRELLNAYNRGPGGVKEVGDDFHYAVGAEKKLARYRVKR